MVIQLPEPKLIGNLYTCTHLLGEGAFGLVFKGYKTDDPHKKPYAIKCQNRAKIESHKKYLDMFYRELRIMNHLKHPNILNFENFVQTNNSFYLVVNYCNNGDLQKKLEKDGHQPEEEAVHYLKQIMNGFCYLHQNNIMHRDFKPANLFLDDDNCIIGDLGFAKEVVEETRTQLGSPVYMAPEILFMKPGQNYNNKSDLYSIGAVYYEMLFNRMPFGGQPLNDEVFKYEQKNKSGVNLEFPKNIEISESSKDLLRRQLVYSPLERIEWAEFFDHKLFHEVEEKEEEVSVKLQSKSGLFQTSRIAVNNEFEQNMSSLKSNVNNSNKVLHGNPMDIETPINGNKQFFDEAKKVEMPKPTKKPEEDNANPKRFGDNDDKITFVSSHMELEKTEEELLIEKRKENWKYILSRYNHELKKTEFIKKVSICLRELFKSLLQEKDTIMNNHLAYGCLLLVHKMVILSARLHISLKSKIDFYGLADHGFEDWLANSHESGVLLKQSKDNLNHYSAVMSHVKSKLKVEVSDQDTEKAIILNFVSLALDHSNFEQSLKNSDNYLSKAFENVLGGFEKSAAKLSDNSRKKYNITIAKQLMAWQSETELAFQDKNGSIFDWHVFDQGFKQDEKVQQIVKDSKAFLK